MVDISAVTGYMNIQQSFTPKLFVLSIYHIRSHFYTLYSVDYTFIEREDPIRINIFNFVNQLVTLKIKSSRHSFI